MASGVIYIIPEKIRDVASAALKAAQEVEQ